jgi:DNA segregation ATPase FtsK/SpoIIIE, S-DNA-T family
VMSGSKDEGALFGYKATEMPPGRGLFVSRTMKTGVIQLSRMPDL